MADLRRYFGKDRVYFDIDSNTSAQNYVTALNRALAGSRAVIAVLGPQWLDARKPDGRRRLDDPDDLVRVELETALRDGIALIPALVQNATMPPAHLLPPSLKTLAYLQAVRLATEDWAYDFGRLLETLENHAVLPASQPETAPPSELTLLATKRYERTLQATRRRAFDALTGAIELLRYPVEESSPEAARVVFHARHGRAITAMVIDAGPGLSKVVLELPTVKAVSGTAASVALAVLFSGPVPLMGLPALWAWQRRFAHGFSTTSRQCWKGEASARIRRCSPAFTPGATANGNCEPVLPPSTPRIPLPPPMAHVRQHHATTRQHTGGYLQYGSSGLRLSPGT